jgi:anti-anti-sigma factor
MKIAEVGGAAAVISEAFPIKSLTDQRKFIEDMDNLISQGKVTLIFNMYKVDYLITIELGSLVAAMKKAKAKGGALKLVGVGEFVDNLLKLTNLKSLFEIYPTEAEALKSLEDK